MGMRAATGNEVDVAINHDKVAIAVHRQNHPTTEHRISDVFEVKPQSATRGRRVGHLHASPDCRHFSRVAGAAPKSDSVRSLADVVIDWARLPEDDGAHPDVITLENVCEFVEWGPLYGERTWRRRASAEVFTGDACPECEWQPTYTAKGKLVKAPERHRACAWRYVTGQPIPERKGEYFKRWCGDLRALGYAIEWWNLYAHHYGSATSRKRLYLVARCDGEPIVKPPPTHGPGLLPYRTAAEHIDFTLPCPSIFDRKKPLADATLRRVAAGIVRFVLENPKPFIVEVNHTGPRAPHSIDKPLTTVTSARRGHALVTPFVSLQNHTEKKNPFDTGRAVDAYAFRATDPLLLLEASRGLTVDVVGPENELHVSNAMKHAHALVFAWGSVKGPDKPFHEGLMGGLARRNNAMPLCLGTTKTGAPRHPLYVSYETALKPWQPGWR